MAMKQSTELLDELKESIEHDDWSSSKYGRSLNAISPTIVTYLDSKDDDLVKSAVYFLKFLIKKMNKRLTSLFEKIIKTVV